MDFSQDAVSEAEKISKINSAGLINLRINNLWIDANKHSRSGNYNQWNVDLDCIWDELSGDVVEDKGKKGDEDKETDFSKYQKLNKDVYKKISELPGSKKGFVNYNKDEKKKFGEVYNLLRDKSSFLRRLQNKQGKGSAYVEDEDQWE